MNTRCSTDLIFASDSPTYLFSTSEKKKTYSCIRIFKNNEQSEHQMGQNKFQDL